MHSDIDRILYTQETIRKRVRELAGEIANCYRESEGGLTLLPVLSGSIIFVADLIRELPLKLKIALVQISSYGGGTTPTPPETRIDLTGDVRGRHVLIVEDILDTGGTLRHLQAMLRRREPASVRTVVMLRKRAKAPADLPVDFVGYDIDDLFVVGYGLDYADYYRNYPHIGVLGSDAMR
jgi:hypoxanthine phosphoribosyltransferase